MANFPSNNAAFPGARIDSRSVFITRTYTHVVGGILGFILIEMALFESGLALNIAQYMLGLPWLLILGAFMLVGWLATRTAQTSTSLGMQYFAYAMYVLVEALIFVPMLYIAEHRAPGTIDSATLVTALGAGGLMFVLMIGFAGAAVLYDTSNIINVYPEDRYVSAAMQLFASIALMFWYVLRLLMGSRN
jgi:FtsH-binding integral membrane protein